MSPVRPCTHNVNRRTGPPDGLHTRVHVYLVPLWHSPARERERELRASCMQAATRLGDEHGIARASRVVVRHCEADALTRGDEFKYEEIDLGGQPCKAFGERRWRGRWDACVRRDTHAN